MDLEVEYLAWVAFYKKSMAPDQDDGRTDAWLEAVGRGEYAGTDEELAQFRTQWEARQAPPADGWDILVDGRR